MRQARKRRHRPRKCRDTGYLNYPLKRQSNRFNRQKSRTSERLKQGATHILEGPLEISAKINQLIREAKIVFMTAIKISTKFLEIRRNEQAREYFKTPLKDIRTI